MDVGIVGKTLLFFVTIVDDVPFLPSYERWMSFYLSDRDGEREMDTETEGYKHGQRGRHMNRQNHRQ